MFSLREAHVGEAPVPSHCLPGRYLRQLFSQDLGDLPGLSIPRSATTANLPSLGRGLEKVLRYRI